MIRKLFDIVRTNPGAIPLFGFAIMVAFLTLSTPWPIHGGDTSRILGEATNLSGGTPLGPTGLAFLVPHAILAAGHGSPYQMHFYVSIQVALSAAATWALFQLAQDFLGNTLWAIVATCLWSMNPIVQKFNFFILSDGPYQSLIVIYAFTLTRLLTRGGRGWLILTLAVLGCATFCRPHGRLLPVATVIALMTAPVTRQHRLIAIPALVAFQVALTLLNRRYSVHMNMVQHFEAGQVIWGYGGFTMAMPPLTGKNLSGMSAVVDYVWSFPIQTTKLFFARVMTEVSNVRPFYSFTHNLMVALFYWPLNLLTVLAMTKSPRSAAKSVILALLVVHLGIVGITHADWDGRWFLQILPFILIMGIYGLDWTGRKIPALKNLTNRIAMGH